MSMTSRERVRVAMQLGVPDQVPVMCQLACGHTLLNSGVDPIEKATTSKATAEAYWHMRELYDFDGILMHKPGRTPEWLEGTKKRLPRRLGVRLSRRLLRPRAAR